MDRIRWREAGDYPLRATAYDADGAAATITGTPTITITDGAGAEVHTGTPTIDAGVLTYDVPNAELQKLDRYKAVWTGTVGGAEQSWTTRFELVGGFLFELADLRGFDLAFSDTEAFSDASLRKARTLAEGRIEKAAHVAFVRRGARDLVSGPHRGNAVDWRDASYLRRAQRLQLSHLEVAELYSVTVAGTALTDDELAAIAVDDSRLIRDTVWPHGINNIDVHYAHGREVLDPLATHCALVVAKEFLVSSSLDPRATAVTAGERMFRITIAGRDGSIGIPEIDEILTGEGGIGRKRYGVG